MEKQEALLAEYQSLRTEILQNDRIIQNLGMFAFWAILIPLALFAYDKTFSGLLCVPPFAVLIYLQLMTHKLEGIMRIATYIATFIEPAIDGLGWETRIRSVDVKLAGISTPTLIVLFGTFGSFFATLRLENHPNGSAAFLLAVAVLIYSWIQLRAAGKLGERFTEAWQKAKPLA